MSDVIVSEEWRPVTKWEGLYEVSSLGRVRRACAGKGTFKGKIIKPSENKDGYLFVGFYGNGKAQGGRYIHRLVAESFIENTARVPCVNHKNGLKQDNRVENLEYVTHQDNVDHSWKNGLVKDRSHEGFSRSGLDYEKAMSIRLL